MMQVLDLAVLGYGPCLPWVGAEFALALASGEVLALRLERVEPLGEPLVAGGRQPCALHFLGPRQPLLAQGVYPLRLEGVGEMQVFMVPLGQTPVATRYEVIFH